MTTSMFVDSPSLMTKTDTFKWTIHEENFVTCNKTTLSFVGAVHEISHVTFYKSLGNRPLMHCKVATTNLTCRDDWKTR